MTPLTLTNRMRVLSPAITSGLCALMFGPLIVSTYLEGPTTKMILGATFFALCIAMYAASAFRAPYEMTIDEASIRIRRVRGERAYAVADVMDWFFSVPDGLPTREPPTTNAVLQLKLNDRTRFRSEVTAEEAAIVGRVFRGANLIPFPGTPGEGA